METNNAKSNAKIMDQILESMTRLTGTLHCLFGSLDAITRDETGASKIGFMKLTADVSGLCDIADLVSVMSQDLNDNLRKNSECKTADTEIEGEQVLEDVITSDALPTDVPPITMCVACVREGHNMHLCKSGNGYFCDSALDGSGSCYVNHQKSCSACRGSDDGKE